MTRAFGPRQHNDELKEKLARVEALTYTRDGDEYEHDDHGIGDGHDACPGCWVEDIRNALRGTPA